MKLSTYLHNGLASDLNVTSNKSKELFDAFYEVSEMKFNVADEKSSFYLKKEILALFEVYNKYIAVESTKKKEMESLFRLPNLRKGALELSKKEFEAHKGFNDQVFYYLTKYLELYFENNDFTPADVDIAVVYYNLMCKDSVHHKNLMSFIQENNLTEQIKNDKEKVDTEAIWLSDIYFHATNAFGTKIYTRKDLDLALDKTGINKELSLPALLEKMKQHHRSAIRESYDIIDYSSRLQMVIDYPDVFNVYDNNIIFSDMDIQLTPSTESEKRLYINKLWDFEKDNLYNTRLFFSKKKQDLPIKSFEELKMSFFINYHDAPHRKNYLEKSLERIKIQIDALGTYKKAFNIHYNRRIECLDIVDVYPADMDFIQKTIFFNKGALADEYAQFVIFLEAFTHEQYEKEYLAFNLKNYNFDTLPLLGIPTPLNQKLSNRKIKLDMNWNGIIHKPISMYKEEFLNIIPSNISIDDLETTIDIFNKFSFFSVKYLSNDDPSKGMTREKLISEYLEILDLIDEVKLRQNIFDCIVKCITSKYSGTPFASKAKLFTKKLQAQYDNVFYKDIPVDDDTAISKFNKIDTKLTVEELAILFRILTESNFIKTTYKKAFRRTVQQVFKSKEGDFEFSSFKKSYNNPSASGLANMNIILNKLMSTLDKID